MTASKKRYTTEKVLQYVFQSDDESNYSEIDPEDSEKEETLCNKVSVLIFDENEVEEVDDDLDRFCFGNPVRKSFFHY